MLEMQIEWGADEAIAEAPVDRRLPAAPSTTPAALPAAAPLPRPRAMTAPAGASPAGTPAERSRAAAAACQTLDALRQALQEGDLPPELAALRATASHLVGLDGNPAAGLVLVGEVPGAEEDRAGQPFLGPAGQLLDRMLASISLDRSQLALTLLVPWRPPGGRAPSEAVVAAALPFLQRQLALLAPRHLVLFGNLALRTVNGNASGLRRCRGRWLDTAIPGLPEPVPTLPMLPPSLLLGQPACKAEAWADLLTLSHRLGTTVQPPPAPRD